MKLETQNITFLDAIMIHQKKIEIFQNYLPTLAN